MQPRGGCLKIFISWSGNDSGAVAKALHELLQLVLPNTKPWLSKVSIVAGASWWHEIRSELAESTVGIACLTAENVKSPWLNFDAGALARTHQGTSDAAQSTRSRSCAAWLAGDPLQWVGILPRATELHRTGVVDRR
ncbi:toll/interleukin-1 receptor domain-containing protein [Luteitalea pratensis]|uniref:toll/interleukin-1 receptor domain-containing protein n=1 Tax=Luteitalea pratensis TaxID=1855912 RepID=UPI000D734F36